MLENIKIFVADVDGTMCEKGESTNEINTKALNDLHKRGVLIGLASGRPYDPRILNYAKDWNLDFDFDFAIACNGIQLYTKEEPNKIQTTYVLQPETVEKIVKVLVKHDFNCINYINGYQLIHALKHDAFLDSSIMRNSSHVEYVGPEEFVKHSAIKLEIHFEDEYEAEMYQIVEELKDVKEAYAVCTHANCMEFLDPRGNKASGLKKYCELQGIDTKDTIAFGDMQNDFELIRDSGYGVCLLNGCDNCKSVAKAITKYNCHDGGVGHFLYDELLNK